MGSNQSSLYDTQQQKIRSLESEIHQLKCDVDSCNARIDSCNKRIEWLERTNIEKDADVQLKYKSKISTIDKLFENFY